MSSNAAPRPMAVHRRGQGGCSHLARQAALAVRNVRLTTRLSDQAAELAASRARLVRAEEAERRRMERNIHDGIQQDLVALIGQAGRVRAARGTASSRRRIGLAAIRIGASNGGPA